jgi:CHAT domain-containing protein
MIQRRQVLIFLLVLLVTPPTAPRAQDEDSANTVSQRQQALSSLLAAAEQSRSSDPVKAAALLNRAAHLQIRLQLTGQALNTYRQALALLDQAPDDSVRVVTLNGIAEAYGHLSECKFAQPYIDKAIALSEQSGSVPGKAEALMTLSECQGYKDPVIALQTAESALELWRSISDQRGMARTYAYMSDFQIAQHQLIEATQSNEAALVIWRQLNVREKQAETLISLGFIEYRKGAMEESLGLLNQAQSLIDEDAEPYMMGQITNGIGEAFVESGMPEAGLPKFQQASQYFRKAENPRAVLFMSWNIGGAYYLQGKYSDARAVLEETIGQAAVIDEQNLIALCRDFLGRTYEALGDKASALTNYELSFQVYSKTNKRREAARTLALIAHLEEQQGKSQQARRHYLSALASLRSLSDRINEAAVLHALGSLELRENNLDPAESYLRQSIDATENVRRISSSRDLTAAFSATVYDRYQTYIECLMKKYQRQPQPQLVAHAFEVSEMARGRSLAELLQATQTNLAAGDPQLASQEKLLRQSLQARENEKIALLGKNYRREGLAALEGEIAKLESQYHEITDTIRARYPAFSQISRPTAWDLAQIQQQIVGDGDTLLLEYSLGGEHSYVWAVTRDRFRSYELAGQSEINDASEKLYKLLTTPDVPNESSLAQATDKLSRLILAPVAKELDKRHVIVVGDGALNYIPFQLLPLPEGGGEPLVGSFEISYAPSASILGQLQSETTRRPVAEKVLAAFGDPVFESNYRQRTNLNLNNQIAYASAPAQGRWQNALRDVELTGDEIDASKIQPLVYTTAELATLRSVAGPEIVIATGFEATREQLAQSDLSKFAILHLATHGVLDPKRPENSGLFLSMIDRQGHAQNGFIGLSDIYRLHAPVDLVVLSACRTGLGKAVRGEGLIGLTRGFMYAGASSVVASLWKVDDEATSELMKRFYSNMLQRNMPPAAALQAAQNSIRQEPQWRSPYFWAAFTLQGEYRQVIRTTGPTRSIGLRLFAGLLATLLVVAAGWGIWRPRRREAVIRH